MTKLSPKAVRFVDSAVIKSESNQIRAVWSAFKREPAKELSDEVARAVLGALQQADRDLRSRLASSSLGEDEAADISNDLGFICAIKHDLQRQVDGEPAETKEGASMMPGLLEDVITLGGRALEAEDRQIRAIVQHRGRHGGLLGTEYERFYQFIVWKSLLEKYEASVEYNHGGYLVDLVIVHDGAPQIFEMKYWRDETTTKIYSDILRLQSFPKGGFLLVFSANQKNLTDENIQSIEALSGISGSASCYRFPTENPKGDSSYEFWFAGWHVPRSASEIASHPDAASR